MVAPKKGDGKEKAEEKKSVTSSPEPFQEPEGMTTIDLNKSDDYSKEIEGEKAKMKQRAQIRYVRRLMMVFVSILFVVSMLISTAYLNREYHLFTVIPLKPNHSNPNPLTTPSSSPTEEFVNLTKLLNEALFRERLKSGSYLDSSYEQMNLCRLKRTLETCCEVFRTTDLSGLVEYCTVNAMLEMLLELEYDHRKKRQAPYYETMYPPPVEQYHDFNQYRGVEERDFHNYPISEGQERESPKVQSFFLPERVRARITQHVTNAPKRERNYVYEDFHPSHNFPKSRKSIIKHDDQNWHETNVDANRNFRLHENNQQFRGNPAPSRFLQENEAFPQEGHEISSSRRSDDMEGGDFNIGELENRLENEFEENQQMRLEELKVFHETGAVPETKLAPFVPRFIGDNGEVENHEELGENGHEINKFHVANQENVDGEIREPLVSNHMRNTEHFHHITGPAGTAKNQADHLTVEEPQNQFNFNEDIQSSKNSGLINPSRAAPVPPGKHQKSGGAGDPSTVLGMIKEDQDRLEERKTNGFVVGDPQKKPLVAKFGESVQVRENVTTNSHDESVIHLEGTEDLSQIKIPPNLKVAKKNDEIDVTTSVLPIYRAADFEEGSKPSPFKFREDAENAGTIGFIKPSRTIEVALGNQQKSASAKEPTNALGIIEDDQYRLEERKTNDFVVGDPQKKPLVSKFGENVQVHDNITTNSYNESAIHLEGSEDSSQIKIPPNLKVSKKKEEVDVTTSVLPINRADEFQGDASYSGNIYSIKLSKRLEDQFDQQQQSALAQDTSSDLKFIEENQDRPQDRETNNFMVGDPQKKPLVAKFGESAQIRENITTDTHDESAIHLEGSEDFSQIKIPPNLKVTKKKDEVDVTTSVLPMGRAAEFEKEPRSSQYELQEHAHNAGKLELVKPSRIIEEALDKQQESTAAKDPTSILEMLGENQGRLEDHKSNDFVVGGPQKKPLVTKFGENVQVRDNITTNSYNESAIHLEGSEDSSQIKIPPNLKVTKKKEEVDVTTSALPIDGASEVQADAPYSGNTVPIKPSKRVDVQFDQQQQSATGKDTPSGLKVIEEDQDRLDDSKTNDFVVGDPQKKPLVAKFGESVQVRENVTTNSHDESAIHLEGSEDSGQIKIPPNLKVSKNKDEVDITTSALPIDRAADFEEESTFSPLEFHEDAETAGSIGFIKPSRITEVPFGNQQQDNAEEASNVLGMIKEDQDGLEERETNNLLVGDPQKKPLVAKFGENAQIRKNITTNSYNESVIYLEGSEDSSLIKFPPNLKVTKKKDEVDVTTSVLPIHRAAQFEEEPKVSQFKFNETAQNSENFEFIRPSEPVREQLFIKQQQSINTQELSSDLKTLEEHQGRIVSNKTEDTLVGVPQKKPLVSKFGEDAQIRENITTNTYNESAIHLEGSEDSGQIKIPPNLKITKKKDEVDITTSILPIARIAADNGDSNVAIHPTEVKLNSFDPLATEIRLGSVQVSQDLNEGTLQGINEDLERSNSATDDFRSKPKQLDALTPIEDIQSNQQSLVNPCYYPYMNPYMSFLPSPANVGSMQDPSYLRVVSVSQPKIRNVPTYVLNPAMYYNMPPSSPYSNFPSNPYLTPNYYPPMAQPVQNHVASTQAASVQVAAPGGQYYLCNPIPTPTNSVAGVAGVEVRRDASDLQYLMSQVADDVPNNRSREATLICPLGEHACLDNSKCVKNHHICDSEVHCDDSSDEVACTCKERVGKLRLCDGYCDCPKCEDEQGCFGCEENEFSCDDWSRFRRSTCIPIVQRCDGIKQCEITGKDELDCSILVDHIGNFPLNKISNSVGFLHRNYKGKWYPTCFGTELWAAQVCQVEAGPSAIIPKAHMSLTTDPYNGLFINILPNNEVSLVNTCVQDRAAFVECPPIYCGLRFLVNNPYRDQEVDTSIEDMLNDLERAYKMRQNGFERSELEPDIDLGRIRKNIHGSVGRSELNLNNGESSREFENNNKQTIVSSNVAQAEHLEEVIENLEKTFRRRDVSSKSFGAILKESRVVGGKPSQPAAWPWLVSIYKNGIFHCGGVLINELWVVTASHCVDRYWQYYYEIQAGVLRRFSYAPMDQRRWAQIVVPHEYYSKSNLRNDIALMKLSAPIRYNRYVRPICLPSESTAGKGFLKGPSAETICTTVGWGATVEHGADPDHMREVEVPILPHCKHNEDSDIEEICAGISEGGKDACQGDSGGPLMCRNPNNPNQWYLAGIVSHGEGCGRPNEPGVYTKVSRYIGWIAENTREDKLTITKPLQKCPGYVCKGTKRCVAKKRRCDRIIDCLLADDEIDCENNFRQLLKHSRKRVIPIATPNRPSDNFMTDIVADLVPLEDLSLVGNQLNSTNRESVLSDDELVEADLHSRKNPEKFEDIYFKCKTLLQVIPIEKRCNKLADCEDGTDEINCSCGDYVKTVDASAICDGVTDCPDLSDEIDCVKCNKTEYTCQLSQKCIEISKRCDGNSDCPQNEDEINCIALTNGHALTLDKDNRPMLKSKGIVTVNHQGQWKPFCLNHSSPFVKDEPSLTTVVCNLLGFDEYLSYHKYQTENRLVALSHSMVEGRVGSMEGPQKCHDCCTGLYVSCSNTSTSTTLHYKSLEQAREVYFSPWMAAIYSNGLFKCMGTLLDPFWIVTSQKCFKGTQILDLNYLVAVLGRGKLQLPVKGPHEQTIRIVDIVNVNGTDIVLLRLEHDVKFNRYVQAAHLNARRDGHRKEKCYAVGQDNEDKILFVRLTPLKLCVVGFRCFEKRIEDHCTNSHAWSGTIICDSRMGWYPAAVFSEEKGQCGFSHETKYSSVRFYKNLIFKIMSLTSQITPPPLCPGFQCPLGNCIGTEKICDNINDCHNGEDEATNLCYEKEKECHLADNCVCPPTHLKCPGTNKCHPKSSFCDRTNDCGEFEDEPDVCSCRNYLRLTDPSKICDGTLNCMDRTDEDPEICSCKLGDFQCGKLNKCIPQEMVCDGVEDCPGGVDEKSCLSLKAEDHERTKAGEVMTMTAGTWHSGCFDLNYSSSELEDMCTKLGFKGSSANQLSPPHNLTTLSTLRPVLDTFEVVWLRRLPGNKLRFRLRSGQSPYVKFVTDKKCHRLFIACI